MKIYSMTATFGKLEQETLMLKPGFNIIHAPNEWGKSTWCAFLTAMLYGLDTRAKSTKHTLADKEHYAPWSGSPMSGRVDVNWNGRDITIERNTKGRIPMGEFRAYETETGMSVAELNATNCGLMLTGVERSVFVRSAFIRLSDLPVTQDEALRRRLNALVSTGDESSAGDRLARGLKDLKNKCRYHKTGLIPQAEAERAALEEKLEELRSLEIHSAKLRQRLEEIAQWKLRLENHKAALAFSAAEADARHVAQARELRDEADCRVSELDALCAPLPEREEIHRALTEIGRLEQARQILEMEGRMSREEILWPPLPGFVGERTPEQALEKAREDRERYHKLSKKRIFWPVLGILLGILGGIGACWYLLPGLAAAGLGAVILLISLAVRLNRKRAMMELIHIYRSGDPDVWVAEARAYLKALDKARALTKKQQLDQAELEARKSALEETVRQMTQGKDLRSCREDWQQALSARDALADARRELRRAEQQFQALQAMARTAQPPEYPDDLTYTESETDRLLFDSYEQRRQLETRLSQYAGRMESLGDEEMLRKQLDVLQSRLSRLEDTYAALTVAQENLAQAMQELQRRFAPRIAKRARELMARMTGGRYDRLQLAEDLSVLAGTEQENVLHEALWRSDGTADQLYLALRLAVAEVLAPDAPLILDDALVRFDDDRLKAALEILKEEAVHKQVILFSCQNREKQMITA